MRYTIIRDQRPPAPRKLAWGVLGLCCALAGSAALAWQDGASKPRTASVEEADEVTPVEIAKPEPPAKAKTKSLPLEDSLPPIVDANSANAPKLPAKRTTAKPVSVQEETEEDEAAAPPAQQQPRATSRRTLSGRSRTTTTAARKPLNQSSGSLLPFLPSFAGGGSSESETQAASSEPKTSSRRTTSISAKALGKNANPRTAGSKGTRTPAEEPRIATSPAHTSRDSDRGLEVEIELPPAQPKASTEVITPKVVAKPSAPPKTEEKPAVAAKPEAAKPVATKPAPRAKTPPRVASAQAKPVEQEVLVAEIPRTLKPLKIASVADVRPAGFQDITPGQSKLSVIAQQLGEPVETEREGDTTVMTYEVGPFPKVEVILAGDVVDSIVIHLNEPVAEKDVLIELGLGNFRTVDVVDEKGQILGSTVPERGVALSYDGDVKHRKVGEVVLASVTAESFALRAAAERDGRYEQVLADAAHALALDPSAADACAAQARVLMALGRVSEARAAIEQAIKLDTGSAEYRIHYARLLAQSGDYDSALKMSQTVATTASVPPEFVAQAELLWGDLLAQGKARDYPAAVEHHTRAIKLATELSQDKHAGIRRAAQLTLLDANLAVARDVALGNYKRKNEVVPKWIAKAEAAKVAALADGAPKTWELRLAAGTLAAYAAMSEPLDPTTAVDAALAKGQELIAASTDALCKQELEWTLGVALVDAVQIEHARGQFDTANQYATNALALLRDNAGHREATPARDFTMARMFFSLGALYAVGQNDHAEAVHYYLQALPLLAQPLPEELFEEQGRHGERFVSMGVSFWQNGNQDQAIELTLAGAELLEAAIAAGQLEKTSLAVPYGNLAAMYKQLGKADEAKKYGDLAQRLEAPKTTRR